MTGLAPNLALGAPVRVKVKEVPLHPPHPKVTLHLNFPCFKIVPKASGVCLTWEVLQSHRGSWNGKKILG